MKKGLRPITRTANPEPQIKILLLGLFGQLGLTELLLKISKKKQENPSLKL